VSILPSSEISVQGGEANHSKCLTNIGREGIQG